jgi:cell division protein FtsL
MDKTKLEKEIWIVLVVVAALFLILSMIKNTKS